MAVGFAAFLFEVVLRGTSGGSSGLTARATDS
jgi:hypothetical protein